MKKEKQLRLAMLDKVTITNTNSGGGCNYIAVCLSFHSVIILCMFCHVYIVQETAVQLYSDI